MPARLPILLLAAASVTFSGCSGFREWWGTTQVDQPVMGPPPPRRSIVQPNPNAIEYASSDAGDSSSLVSFLGDDGTDEGPVTTAELPVGDGGNVQPAGYQFKTFTYDGSGHLDDSQIVATVNGVPIFAADILERYSSFLSQRAAQMTPDQLDKMRMELIRRDLDQHLDRELLAYTLRSTLSDEQIEMIGKQMDKAFEEKLKEMQGTHGVESMQQLEAELVASGTSLAALRSLFEKQALAGQYLQMNSKLKKIGRPEIFAFYNEHQQEYFRPAKVRWQQIQVSYGKHGGKPQAVDRLKQAVAQLQSGGDFADVAREYSDHTSAENGGLWDWMEAGSLKNQELEQALFELPVGQISPPFWTDGDVQIVRVLERNDAGYVPFEKVQKDIEQQLVREQREAVTERVLRELRQTATIETIFDAKQPAGS